MKENQKDCLEIIKAAIEEQKMLSVKYSLNGKKFSICLKPYDLFHFNEQTYLLFVPDLELFKDTFFTLDLQLFSDVKEVNEKTFVKKAIPVEVRKADLKTMRPMENFTLTVSDIELRRIIDNGISVQQIWEKGKNQVEVRIETVCVASLLAKLKFLNIDFDWKLGSRYDYYLEPYAFIYDRSSSFDYRLSEITPDSSENIKRIKILLAWGASANVYYSDANTFEKLIVVWLKKNFDIQKDKRKYLISAIQSLIEKITEIGTDILSAAYQNKTIPYELLEMLSERAVFNYYHPLEKVSPNFFPKLAQLLLEKQKIIEEEVDSAFKDIVCFEEFDTVKQLLECCESEGFTFSFECYRTLISTLAHKDEKNIFKLVEKYINFLDVLVYLIDVGKLKAVQNFISWTDCQPQKLCVWRKNEKTDWLEEKGFTIETKKINPILINKEIKINLLERVYNHEQVTEKEQYGILKIAFRFGSFDSVKQLLEEYGFSFSIEDTELFLIALRYNSPEFVKCLIEYLKQNYPETKLNLYSSIFPAFLAQEGREDVFHVFDKYIDCQKALKLIVLRHTLSAAQNFISWTHCPPQKLWFFKENEITDWLEENGFTIKILTFNKEKTSC